MKYLKEREGDKCPASRFVLGGWLVPLEHPKWEKLREKVENECPDCFLVDEGMCHNCPDRRTMYIGKDGKMTIQCDYKNGGK